MVFLHGLGLNCEEEGLLIQLVKSLRKPVNATEYMRIIARLADLICEEVANQEHRIPEYLDEALQRLNEELYGKLNPGCRDMSTQDIRYFVETNKLYHQAFSNDTFGNRAEEYRENC